MTRTQMNTRNITTSINAGNNQEPIKRRASRPLTRSLLMRRWIVSMSLPTALAITGCAHSQDKSETSSHSHDMGSMSSTESGGQQASGVDLHNTICPVSGDKVESSPLTQTYDGKVYHLCCKDCVKPFTEDPGKYAKAVADDPAKYGVK